MRQKVDAVFHLQKDGRGGFDIGTDKESVLDIDGFAIVEMADDESGELQEVLSVHAEGGAKYTGKYEKELKAALLADDAFNDLCFDEARDV